MSAKHTEGYVLIYKPKHPACNKQGYVFEHRLVMEKYLGRFLSGKEIIHHKNRIRDDNRLCNLQLFSSNKDHLRVHKGWIKKGDKWFKKCPDCKKFLEVNSENWCIRKKGKGKDSPTTYCKKCGSIRWNKWWKNRPDLKRLADKKYNESHKEEKKEYDKQYRLRKRRIKSGRRKNKSV